MLKPRVSAWLTGLRETVEELPDFVRVAAETGVKEVHLQRLVFFNDNAIGMARPDQALYEQLPARRPSISTAPPRSPHRSASNSAPPAAPPSPA